MTRRVLMVALALAGTVVSGQEPSPAPSSFFLPSDLVEQVLGQKSPEGYRPGRPLPFPPEKHPTLSDRLLFRAGAMTAYNEALALAKTGKRREAIAAYGKALSLDSSNAEAHYGLGLEYGRMAHLDAAKREFEAALKIRPGYLEASAGLSRATAAIEARQLEALTDSHPR